MSNYSRRGVPSVSDSRRRGNYPHICDIYVETLVSVIEGADGFEICAMSAFRVSGLMQQNNPSGQIIDIGHIWDRGRAITMLPAVFC